MGAHGCREHCPREQDAWNLGQKPIWQEAGPGVLSAEAPPLPGPWGTKLGLAGIRGVGGEAWHPESLPEHPLQGLQDGVLQSATRSAKCPCHRHTF